MNRLILLILAGSFFMFNGCEYEKTEPVEEIENVSLSNDLMPIFNRSCNMGGCHDAGGIPPDLTEENAYIHIILLNQVDTNNPESSILYDRMQDPRNPMPPEGLLSEYEINLVLQWIKEGIKDN